MTCASGSASVEKTLKATDGVESASVNLATETASIRFDPARVRLRASGSGVAGRVGCVENTGTAAQVGIERPDATAGTKRQE